MLPKLSHIELAVGFLIQLPFYYVLGEWVLILSTISAFLWAYGGSEDGDKIFRRYLVPLSTCIGLALSDISLVVFVCLVPAILIVSMGYGEKSRLWTAFMRHTKDRRISDYATRMTTYTLYWLTFGLFLITSAQ